MNLDWSWGRSRRRAHTWEREVREVGPVPELAGIAADADPVRVRGRRAVEDEDLPPAGRADKGVRGRDDSASVAVAAEFGEQCAHAHRVAVLEQRRSESIYAGNTQERRGDKPCSKLLADSRMVRSY